MRNSVRVTADDIGLTRAVTDSILACADAGALTQVSILANGLAFDYAVAEYAKRSDKLAIALHANLTEGPALSPKETIPHLVDSEGFFRFSPGGLWFKYLFSLPRARQAIRKEVTLELSAQWRRLQTALSSSGASVTRLDGHQHVHMVPFIFDAAMMLPGLSSVRITCEPLYLVPNELSAYINFHALSRIILNFLGKRNRRVAKQKGIN